MSHNETSTYSGWVGFAAFMMMLAGIFQSIVGLAAIFKPDVYFITAKNALLVLSYTQWGWVHLIIGLVVFLAAFSLLAGSMWGKFVAIFLALLSAIANFGFIKAYPLWSIMIIIIDIMVIVAVVKYSADEED